VANGLPADGPRVGVAVSSRFSIPGLLNSSTPWLLDFLTVTDSTSCVRRARRANSGWGPQAGTENRGRLPSITYPAGPNRLPRYSTILAYGLAFVKRKMGGDQKVLSGPGAGIRPLLRRRIRPDDCCLAPNWRDKSADNRTETVATSALAIEQGYTTITARSYGRDADTTK